MCLSVEAKLKRISIHTLSLKKNDRQIQKKQTIWLQPVQLSGVTLSF